MCPHLTCLIEVPNRLYACSTHWSWLTPETKAEIYRTARRNVTAARAGMLARAAATRMAQQDWEDHG